MAFNMDPKKCPMPTQDPNVRNKNFEEVALGYTAEMAVNEAKRCIHCKNKPCQTGCPVGIDIPEFIGHVAEGDFEAAYQVINRSSSLPAVCGRVCPQESQCEGKCTRGIKNEPVGIGRLERFVADWHRENVHTAPIVPASNGHKVAIIGAGPAGLTAAGDLAKLGYKVTVYEALHVAGGVLMYGIPEFRLPKAIVQQEIDGLKKMGVDFECNMVIGKVLTIDELMGEYGYEAVFVGSGAGLPRFMGIPGESLKGVYSANEFLTRSNLMKAYLPTARPPSAPARKWPLWVAAMWPWTLPAALCAWVLRRSTSSTAAAWPSCPPARKRLSTQRRRASSSRPFATLWRSCLMRTVSSRPLPASRWNWVSRTLPADAAPLRKRAASLPWMWIPSS